MRVERILQFLALLVLCAFMLFPIYWMVMTALLPTDAVLSRTPSLLPDPALANTDAFGRVFVAKPFLSWLTNTVLVAAIATVISMALSVFAGYSLSRWRYWPQQALGASMLFSKLIPTSLIIIPIFVIYATTGMLNTYWGLILAHLTLGVPLASWVMKGVFDRVPREIDHAALIDGCGQLQLLTLVLLPLVRPGIAATGIYLLIVSWSEFVFARTLMRGDDRYMLTVGIQSFVGEHTADWATLMAAGTISLIPVAILFILLEPFLVSGMTKGALAN